MYIKIIFKAKKSKIGFSLCTTKPLKIENIEYFNLFRLYADNRHSPKNNRERVYKNSLKSVTFTYSKSICHGQTFGGYKLCSSNFIIFSKVLKTNHF